MNADLVKLARECGAVQLVLEDAIAFTPDQLATFAARLATTQASDPTKDDPADPMFEAIWEVIKPWDLNRERGAGYAAATGDDVMTILRAVRTALAAQAPQAPAEPNTDDFYSAWDEWSPTGAASFDDFQAGWVKALRAVAAQPTVPLNITAKGVASANVKDVLAHPNAKKALDDVRKLREGAEPVTDAQIEKAARDIWGGQIKRLPMHAANQFARAVLALAAAHPAPSTENDHG